jgi:hypothetical protein
MFAYPDRKMIASVSGSILPHVQVERFGPSLGGDLNIQQFRMIAAELGSHNRIADITGIIQPDGWMVRRLNLVTRYSRRCCSTRSIHHTRCASELVLSAPWQIIGAIDAVDGVLLLGLITSFMITVMQVWWPM